MGARVLVVDDDRKTVDLVRLYLEHDGYQVASAYDGQQAIQAASETQPDLVVLDLMLPKVDGLDVLQSIRRERRVPVVLLTARATEEDKLTGLDLGADDYLTKPFSPRELVARVRAVLRRAQAEAPSESSTLCFGELTIDLAGHEARINDRPVQLTPREFQLLKVMAGTPGRAFSRIELLERAIGYDYQGLERTVDVHLSSLRRKLGGSYVATVYGVGYRFEARR